MFQAIEELETLITQIEKDIKKGKYTDQKSGSVPSALRYIVWTKYASETLLKSKCFCCRTREIEVANFHCGHVISHHDGGPVSLENLRPVCGQCNSSMGTENMVAFIKRCGFWTQCQSNNNNTVDQRAIIKSNYRPSSTYEKKINPAERVIIPTGTSMTEYLNQLKRGSPKILNKNRVVSDPESDGEIFELNLLSLNPHQKYVSYGAVINPVILDLWHVVGVI